MTSQFKHMIGTILGSEIIDKQLEEEEFMIGMCKYCMKMPKRRITDYIMSKTLRGIYKTRKSRRFVYPLFHNLIMADSYFKEHPEMANKLYLTCISRIKGEQKSYGLSRAFIVRKWLRYIMRHGMEGPFLGFSYGMKKDRIHVLNVEVSCPVSITIQEQFKPERVIRIRQYLPDVVQTDMTGYITMMENYGKKDFESAMNFAYYKSYLKRGEKPVGLKEQDLPQGWDQVVPNEMEDQVRLWLGKPNRRNEDNQEIPHSYLPLSRWVRNLTREGIEPNPGPPKRLLDSEIDLNEQPKRYFAMGSYLYDGQFDPKYNREPKIKNQPIIVGSLRVVMQSKRSYRLKSGFLVTQALNDLTRLGGFDGRVRLISDSLKVLFSHYWVDSIIVTLRFRTDVRIVVDRIYRDTPVAGSQEDVLGVLCRSTTKEEINCSSSVSSRFVLDPKSIGKVRAKMGCSPDNILWFSLLGAIFPSNEEGEFFSPEVDIQLEYIIHFTGVSTVLNGIADSAGKLPPIPAPPVIDLQENNLTNL